MTKTIRRLITSGVLAVLTVLLVALAMNIPGFFNIYPAISRKILSALAAFTAPVPFAVWEWVALGLFVWAIVSLVLSLRKHHFVRWLSGVLEGVCIGVFLFVGIWGLNHFGPAIQEKMAFSVGETSVAQLKEATEYYLSVANELSTQVPRDKNGLFGPGKFEDLAKQAGNGYQTLAKQYDLFDGSTVRVKKLTSSYFFGKMGITGIFVDFTGESCVSTKTFAASVPFTMCHEIGHRMAIAAENEANFAAFLACDASDSVIFRYSGYYEAFSYCFSALSKADPDAAGQVWAQVNEWVAADRTGAYHHYEQVTSETAEKISDTVNDTYLKAFSQSSGVQSYGEVADLLIAWYFRTK